MAVKLQGITLPKINGMMSISDFALLDFISQIPSANSSAIDDGLVGAYVFTNKNVDRTYNYANPNKPLTRVGNPDESSDNYSKLGLGLGYYDTGLPPTATNQIIALIQAEGSVGSPAFLISNYSKGSPTTGDTFIISGTKIRIGAYSSGASNISLTPEQSIGVSGKLAAVGGNINSGGGMATQVLNDSVTITYGSVASVTRALQQNTLMIGGATSNPVSGFNGTFKLSALFIYSQDVASNTNMNLKRFKWIANELATNIGA